MLYDKAIFKIPKDILHGDAHSFDFLIQSAAAWDWNLLDRNFQQEGGLQLDMTVIPRADTPNIKEEKWVVTFQKIDSPPLTVTNFDGGGRDLEVAAQVSGERPNNVQLPMSVLPGAVVNEAESLNQRNLRAVTRFRNFVRLHRFNPCLEVIGEFPFIEGAFFEPFGGVANRKFKSIFIGGNVSLLEEQGSLVNRGVKSGPKLVKELTQLKSKAVFGGDFSLGPEKARCPVAVCFGHQLVGVWICDSLPLSLKGFQVKGRSIDSLPAFGKEAHASKS